MKFIDFFAGIGGFRRGMELAGHRCVGFCEWDKYATASYTSMHLITDEQRDYLSTLTQQKRQKEILKDEYRNGEWYADDIRTVCSADIPKADCWCFGAPCQDFSLGGQRAGLKGDRSSLVREIFRLLEEQAEEDRPEWLVYENVQGMLSSNGGFDFFEILCEMDRWGYDVEWQLLNTRLHGIPQNRPRVYTVGHSRRFGRCKIFPIKRTHGASCVEYKPNGQGPVIAKLFKQFPKSPYLSISDSFICDVGSPFTSCLMARYYKGISGHKDNMVLHPFSVGIKEATLKGFAECMVGGQDSVNLAFPNSETRRGRIGKGVAQTLDCSCNQGIIVELENGGSVYAYWYEREQKYIAIRKLTPRECFRLQGWSDDYFDKAQFVNSDTQLYKQAGNGVSVNVVYDVAKRIGGINEQ